MFLVLLSIISFLSIPLVLADLGFSKQVTGDLTYYIPDNNYGSCGNILGNNDRVTAISHKLYDAIGGSRACGSCIEVFGSKGSIKVTVQDRCAGCKYNDVDLTIGAFSKIEDLAKGRVKVNWRPCDSSKFPAPLSSPYNSGSSKISWFYGMGYGSCGIPIGPQDMVAAMSPKVFSKYGGNSICGKTIIVTAPNGSSVKVKITDKCISCSESSVQISKPAFQKLASPAVGIILGGSWRFSKYHDICLKQMLAGQFKTCAAVASKFKVDVNKVTVDGSKDSCKKLKPKDIICFAK